MDMNTLSPKLTVLLTLLLLLHSAAAPENSPTTTIPLPENPSNTTATYGPWLRGIIKNPRRMGCRRRPWICRQDDTPRVRRRCCRNRCVDVTSDPNNCGLCGIRCPFTWQCCRGLCSNTNLSPFNCGGCGQRCFFPRFCFYGMCGYAQPLPPFPFPPRPRPYPQSPAA
ncbi:Stigma-specific STIG1-like protein 4 [Striga hermonthica]|uniref:Stigma-specific STIG1-like protein 4 n=1 Tax=Striga hermonthica TaxID=68872 RepID=A0A9N7MVU5_STRHE|nr:Stigma-specific STIG1-like protein 4 [Striga hermonthica]